MANLPSAANASQLAHPSQLEQACHQLMGSRRHVGLLCRGMRPKLPQYGGLASLALAYLPSLHTMLHLQHGR